MKASLLNIIFAVAVSFTATANAADRIVSLAPSLTNIVTALGASDSLVAVSSYCKDSSLKELPKVGGLFNINFEAIYKLKPDAVILLSGHAGAKKSFQKLDIKTLSVKNETVSQITESIEQIGALLNHEEKAQFLISQINQKISLVKDKKNKEKILVIIDSAVVGSDLVSAIAAARGSIYGDILESLGLVNAVDSLVKYPKLSRETIATIEYDKVVLLVSGSQNAKSFEAWRNVSGNDLHVISDDLILTPGVNLVEILESFDKAI